MFANAGMRVLLIDCDLATNGATYFFENKLENSKKIYTLHNILYDESSLGDVIKVSDNLSFMPSISNLHTYEKDVGALQSNREIVKARFANFYKSIQYRYDIVIFDCQAGYSIELEAILPCSDFNMAVMEADAVSSAAMRSLYLKIGHIIQERKLFQTFNKLSSDEYHIYSKVSGGTVFTNIEAVLFDWAIKKAFAVSEVPNLTDTNIKYVEQILNICQVIFNTVIDNSHLAEKFSKYEKVLTLNKLEKKKKDLRDNINKMKGNKRNPDLYWKAIFMALPLVMAIVCFAITLTIDTPDYVATLLIAVLVPLFCCASVIGGIYAMSKPYRRSIKVVKNFEEEISELNTKIDSIKKSIEKPDENNSAQDID